MSKQAHLVLLLTALMLSACATVPPVEIGSNVDSSYRLPASYQEHRNQQQFYTTSKGRIAYTDHGRGQVLILLHGVPTSSWMYRKLIPLLQNDMRVISVDLLGYGSSDKPEYAENIYSPTQQAERVLSLLDSLDIDEYSLLMHDMGGLVAWEMLERSLRSVTHTIVLDTIINEHGFDHPDFEPGVFTRQLFALYGNDLTSAEILALTFEQLGLAGEYKLNENECYGYVQPMREGADQAVYAFFTHLNSDLFERLDDYKSSLSSYSGKTLVLWAGQDETLTTEQIPILQETLSVPDENIHIYQKNGHFLAEEIPEELAVQIVKFMDE